MPKTKRCQGECGLLKPIEEFRIKERRASGHSAMPTVYRARVCKVCEVARRTAAREQNLYRVTFQQRRRNHAHRWGYSVAELEGMGWDLERRSIEMQAMFENAFCPLCIEYIDGQVSVHFYRDMKHGLEDLTIDRIDPSKPPVWPGNIWWVDKTCNGRKHHGDPILHGQRLQAEHELRLFEHAEWSADQLIAGQQSLFD